MAIDVQQASAELAALVREHDVAYEVVGEDRAIARRPPARVGYRVRLIGSPSHTHGDIAPGCQVCQATFRALVRIATAVLPREQRATRYELGPFDAAWHVAADRPHGIELSIVLLGRKDAGEPVEACQRECLMEIERRLRELGVVPAGSRAARGASHN